MSGLVRDSAVGQLIRWATSNKYLQYPEEKPDFRIPESYQHPPKTGSSTTTSPDAASPLEETEKELEGGAESDNRPDTESHRANAAGAPNSQPPDTLAQVETAADIDARSSNAYSERTLSKIVTRPELHNVTTRQDLEQAYTNATRQETLKTQASRPIQPQVTSDGIVLVDWYTTDDPENPQNWSSGKKLVVVFQIYLYTMAVYMGSAIFTPSEPYIAQQFGVSENVAALGLSMYILGYGVGPLIFSPLSEIPIIGRNPPYILTLGIFVIISIPTAVVNNFPALIVLRFLQGFFGSPCLATGGASIGDIYSLLKLPYFLTGWAAFTTCGPSLGPLISGFSVPAEDWHWSLWEIVWLTSPIYIVMLFLLPETSASNILLRRAARLRKLTGNNRMKAQSEIDQEKLTVNEVVVGNLWRPVQINALDPAVLFTSLYTALMYSIFYSFFEVFPLVYANGNPGTATHGYGMNAGEIGLIFLSIIVGVSIAISIYVSYLHWVFEPEIKTKGLGAPERRLVPGLPATFLLPIGLFWFGWTADSSPNIHWIVPTLGVVVFTIGIFILFQCIFIYIPLTYPQYAASLFAGNDFARSSVAAAAIHFSQPLFRNLGVGRGVSLLAGLTVGGIAGIFALWKYGATLRARSRFAVK